MSLGQIIRSIFEILLVGFIIWGVFNEDKFVRFEDKIAAYFRRKGFKVIKGNYSPARSNKKIS